MGHFAGNSICIFVMIWYTGTVFSYADISIERKYYDIFNHTTIDIDTTNAFWLYWPIAAKALPERV
jgi:hypothetical protein